MPGMLSVVFCGNTVKISSTSDEAYTSYSTITVELPLTSSSNLEHPSVSWMSNRPLRRSRLHLQTFCTFITHKPSVYLNSWHIFRSKKSDYTTVLKVGQTHER